MLFNVKKKFYISQHSALKYSMYPLLRSVVPKISQRRPLLSGQSNRIIEKPLHSKILVIIMIIIIISAFTFKLKIKCYNFIKSALFI